MTHCGFPTERTAAVSGRRAERGAERVPLPFHREQVEQLDACPRVYRDDRAWPERLRASHLGAHAPQAVSRQLGRGSIGIEETHGGASILTIEQDQAVAADTQMAVAERSRKRARRAVDLCGRDQEEVVAVRVRLDDAKRRHQGTLNAVHT
jgi:hypothetical protein